MEWLLIVKLICAHLLSDFVLQPNAWVQSRTEHKIRSKALYYHIGVTVFTAALLTGFSDWVPVIIICITHYLIDLWKAYQPNTRIYFFADQVLHLLVITAIGIWYPTNQWDAIIAQISQLDTPRIWVAGTVLLFLTQPAGIIIGKLIEPWRREVDDQAETLKNAGIWIGTLERCLIFCFVLNQQYEIIGWLLAAKSILRFKETFAPKRTEYLLIGSLLSVGVAIILGVAVKALP